MNIVSKIGRSASSNMPSFGQLIRNQVTLNGLRHEKEQNQIQTVRQRVSLLAEPEPLTEDKKPKKRLMSFREWCQKSDNKQY